MKDFFTRVSSWIWANKWKSLGIFVVVALVIFAVVKPKAPTVPLVFGSVERGDLTSTVLATGQVTAVTDLSLSFSASDTLRTLRVKVGDTVKQGDILATLDNRDELASLTSARGALASAKASYQKLLEGASSEEINVSAVALENAKVDLVQTKQQQDQLVANAYQKLLATDLSATITTSYTSAIPTITGTYSGSQEGTYTISVDGTNFNVVGLEKGFGKIETTVPVPLGTHGLFIQFPANFSLAENISSVWEVRIPNTQSTSYIMNLTAYRAALDTRSSAVNTAESVVRAREADLALKQAAARPAEIAAAQAEILAAEGKVQTAQVAYDNTILRAPAPGTITAIDIKLGELVSSQVPVITLQDISNMYLEAKINESNITTVALGQKVRVTFDAFGPDRVFDAVTSSIDPSSTITEGVVNYKVHATVTDTSDLRPGMTANMTIITGEKLQVLFVPKTAIHSDTNGSFVYVVTDQKRKKYEHRAVAVGFVGDGNRVEVTNGLSEGEMVVVSGAVE